MQTGGFNKSTHHRLTTSELTVGLSLKFWEFLLKINCLMVKINGVLLSEPDCCKRKKQKMLLKEVISKEN